MFDATLPSRPRAVFRRRAMTSLLGLAGAMALMPSAAQAQAVVVTRAGASPSTAGAGANFTGAVRVDSRFQQVPPGRVSGGIVTFEPGARTAWHTHPLGQTLVVTAGIGLVQSWDGPVQEIRTGDIVVIPPGIKHWHGATAGAAMAHVAFAEALDGKTVEWMEHVTDAQYRRGAG